MPDEDPTQTTGGEQQETGGTTQETGGTTQETGGTTQETGGEQQGEQNPAEETTNEEETFPSFRKAYKYRGGFDKFVYDQLKKANDGESE